MADEDGGGGVFSFLGADKDGVGWGGIEGDLCLLGMMARDEEGSDLYWEMVSDHRG